MYETFLQQINGFWSKLDDKPEETPESILGSLWLTAAGIPTSAALAKHRPLPKLSDSQLTDCKRLIELRQQGTPLAHLTGRQNFMGLEMLAGPEALIPRVETEILASSAIAKLAAAMEANGSATIVDVCTGSGNVPLACANTVLGSKVYGSDLSEKAVELARRNAEHLSLADRVEFRQGDLLKPFDTPEFLGQLDVLTCNPPYISSAKVGKMRQDISAHEPELAFDGGPFGVSILLRLVAEAPRFLKKGGWLGFEVGVGQGPAMHKKLLAMNVFSDLENHSDAAGNVRSVFARLK